MYVLLYMNYTSVYNIHRRRSAVGPREVGYVFSAKNTSSYFCIILYHIIICATCMRQMYEKISQYYL